MAFTAIDGDTSWQDLALAEELAEGYNLRRQIFGLSTIETPTQDTQVYAFVRALQEGIEEMIGYDYYGYGAYYGWLLNTAALSTYSGQSSYPTPLTLATGMTAAGLTASGYWRRIAEGGTQPATWTNYAAAGWSYGKINEKDLAGPWLFKDLQLALSALTRVQLRQTERRSKYNYYNGAGPIPSTALSWGSWGASGYDTEFSVGKAKTGTSISYVVASISVAEVRSSMPDGSAACETDRVYLVIPSDLNPTYGSKASKMTFANLGVSDVSTVIGETVENTTSKSSSGGTTFYSAVLAEDETNLTPLANDILPDSSVPDNGSLQVDLKISAGRLIIDFEFE